MELPPVLIAPLGDGQSCLFDANIFNKLWRCRLVIDSLYFYTEYAATKPASYRWSRCTGPRSLRSRVAGCSDRRLCSTVCCHDRQHHTHLPHRGHSQGGNRRLRFRWSRRYQRYRSRKFHLQDHSICFPKQKDCSEKNCVPPVVERASAPSMCALTDLSVVMSLTRRKDRKKYVVVVAALAVLVSPSPWSKGIINPIRSRH